jgi:hypothetical protein
VYGFLVIYPLLINAGLKVFAGKSPDIMKTVSYYGYSYAPYVVGFVLISLFNVVLVRDVVLVLATFLSGYFLIRT